MKTVPNIEFFNKKYYFNWNDFRNRRSYLRHVYKIILVIVLGTIFLSLEHILKTKIAMVLGTIFLSLEYILKTEIAMVLGTVSHYLGTLIRNDFSNGI